MTGEGRGKKTAEREGDQRARIVAAATETYAAKGYDATTIDDICRAAKMSSRTLYVHFRTLADVRFAVLEAALQTTLVEAARVATLPPGVDRLEAVLRTLFGALVSSPNLARVVIYELRRPEQRNLETRQQVLSFFVHAWMAGHEEDRALGRMSYPVDEATLYALVGSVEGAAAWYLETNQEAKGLEAVPILLAIIRGIYPFQV